MLIAEETTLNPMEAAMAIRQLRKVMQRLLLDGKSVKLGDWGTFNVTLNTEGADTREALTAHNVKRVNINFQPGDELKTAMQKADFVWLDKLTEMVHLTNRQNTKKNMKVYSDSIYEVARPGLPSRATRFRELGNSAF